MWESGTTVPRLLTADRLFQVVYNSTQNCLQACA